MLVRDRLAVTSLVLLTCMKRYTNDVRDRKKHSNTMLRVKSGYGGFFRHAKLSPTNGERSGKRHGENWGVVEDMLTNERGYLRLS